MSYLMKRKRGGRDSSAREGKKTKIRKIRMRLLRVSDESEGEFDNTSANAHGGEAIRVRLLRVSGE